MPPPKTIGEAQRVEIAVYGDRNFPTATAKLSIVQVTDLAAIILGAQMIQPELSPEDVIRAIWRYGSDIVAKGLGNGAKLRPPAAKPVPVPPERYRAGHSTGD